MNLACIIGQKAATFQISTDLNSAYQLPGSADIIYNMTLSEGMSVDSGKPGRTGGPYWH